MSRLGQGLLALLLLLLAAALFLLAYERRSEEEWTPPQTQALRQPYLAAERLLQQRAVEAVAIDALEQLQLQDRGAGNLLLLPAGRGLVTENALAALEGYLAAGGHLLVESEPAFLDDPVFDFLGIERSPAPPLEDDYGEHVLWGEDWYNRYRQPLAPLSPFNPDLLRLRWRTEGEELVIASRGGELLQAAGSLREVRGDDGVRMLQLARGAGLVTAVNDLGFAENWRIGRHDNAEFFWLLVQERPDTRAVLLFRAQSEGLLGWLRQNAWMPLCSGALLLLLALWRAMPRFGPLAADPEPERRRLGDHLLASGRFLWARGQRGRLLRAALAQARAELYRCQPHLRLLEPVVQSQWLVQQHGLSAAQAQAIISADATLGEGSRARQGVRFQTLIRGCRRLLQSLRERAAGTSSAAATATPKNPPASNPRSQIDAEQDP